MPTKRKYNQAAYDEVQAMALRYRNPECGEVEKRRIESEMFTRFKSLSHRLAIRGVRAGVDEDILLSAAFKGIGDALQKYDPAFNKPFPSYVSGLMFNYVRIAFADARDGAKTAVIKHLFSNNARYSRIIDAVPQGQSRDAAYEEIAALVLQTNAGKKEKPETVMRNVRRFYEEGVSMKTVSLTTPVCIEGDISLVDVLTDENAQDPADIVAAGSDRQETYKILCQALGQLSPREAEILLRRANDETLEALSQDFGVSRERVRQIEEKAKEKAARIIVNIAKGWRLATMLGVDVSHMPQKPAKRVYRKIIDHKGQDVSAQGALPALESL